MSTLEELLAEVKRMQDAGEPTPPTKTPRCIMQGGREAPQDTRQAVSPGS